MKKNKLEMNEKTGSQHRNGNCKKKKKKNLKKETLQMKNTTEIKFLWIGSRAEWWQKKQSVN